MSLLINDNLIWVSIPKCASSAIENALYSSNLNIKPYTYIEPGKHSHISLDLLKKDFGNKESICITRDWFDKWLSALNHLWDVIEFTTSFQPICKWEEMNNETIYKIFDNKFLNNLHLVDTDGYTNCFDTLFLNVNNLSDDEKQIAWMSTLISEKYYKSNQKCTYEFDIKELNKFVDFIEDRFGEKLIIEKVNQSTKRPNKIVINDELKQFVWDNFEKRFEKSNQLI